MLNAIVKPMSIEIDYTLITKVFISSLLLLCGFVLSDDKTIEPTMKQNDKEIRAASTKANAIFDQIFMEEVMSSPVFQTYLGIKQDYDKWDNVGEAADKATLERNKQQLKMLKTVDKAQLDAQTELSYQLMEKGLEQAITDFQWRLYNYPVNQMFGAQSFAPSFLINQHMINSVADANAYIKRLQALPAYFKQVIEQLKVREKNGIMAPKFVYKYTINDSQNIITGRPFDHKAFDSALFADFKQKVERLKITKKEKNNLIAQASKALTTYVKPAYRNLIVYLGGMEKRADTNDGIWKAPKGRQFYLSALKETTTTELSPEEIHQMGLREVDRIHMEMRRLMQKVQFKGSLQDFFAFMRTDGQFYKAETDEGRKAYMAQVNASISAMKSKLPEAFNVLPKAKLIVKPVEAFREDSAGKAFYQQPAPDGSRPGIYYANLSVMREMPTYQLQALAFHEAVPGHHMQIAIAQELEGLPKFRRFNLFRYTAYTEGWGLYSEYLAKEMGFYKDPYSDFGRLAMELMRACRLVVDTGIHDEKWTREQAIDYLVKNTPDAKNDIIRSVERYIVMPSQATAYKVGMLKILELREKSRQQLGNKFDIRSFHDVILKNGPVPLDILEGQVQQWVYKQQNPS